MHSACTGMEGVEEEEEEEEGGGRSVSEIK